MPGPVPGRAPAVEKRWLTACCVTPCVTLFLIVCINTEEIPECLISVYRIDFESYRSWLRLCSTSRKVAGSIPDGVIGIFQLYNPSGRVMPLELTQPPTEMSIRNICRG
jgi:hypothetical protein